MHAADPKHAHALVLQHEKKKPDGAQYAAPSIIPRDTRRAGDSNDADPKYGAPSGDTLKRYYAAQKQKHKQLHVEQHDEQRYGVGASPQRGRPQSREKDEADVRRQHQGHRGHRDVDERPQQHNPRRVMRGPGAEEDAGAFLSRQVDEQMNIREYNENISRYNAKKEQRRPYNADRVQRHAAQVAGAGEWWPDNERGAIEGSGGAREDRGGAERMVDVAYQVPATAAGVARIRNDDGQQFDFLKNDYAEATLGEQRGVNLPDEESRQLRTAGAARRPDVQPGKASPVASDDNNYGARRPGSASASASAPFANYSMSHFRTSSRELQEAAVHQHHYQAPQFARRRAPDLQITGPSMRNGRRPQSARNGAAGGGGGGAHNNALHNIFTSGSSTSNPGTASVAPSSFFSMSMAD